MIEIILKQFHTLDCLMDLTSTNITITMGETPRVMVSSRDLSVGGVEDAMKYLTGLVSKPAQDRKPWHGKVQAYSPPAKEITQISEIQRTAPSISQPLIVDLVSQDFDKNPNIRIEDNMLESHDKRGSRDAGYRPNHRASLSGRANQPERPTAIDKSGRGKETTKRQEREKRRDRSRSPIHRTTSDMSSDTLNHEFAYMRHDLGGYSRKEHDKKRPC